MSEGSPTNPPPTKLPEQDLSPAQEKKLEAILEKGVEKIPPEQFPNLFRDTLIAFIERGTGPRIDPETLKIAAATLEKDNENKFQYLVKKLETDANTKNDDREFDKEKFRSTTKLLWPIVLAIIVVILGLISSGIYLAAIGKETLGFSILSATLAALFSYLGGLGTPRFWDK